MGLLQNIKNKNASFFLRTKEEVEQLFAELRESHIILDSQWDFNIRMALKKVKLQFYYEELALKYKEDCSSTCISEDSSTITCNADREELSHPNTLNGDATQEAKKKKGKRKKQKAKRSLSEYDQSIRGMSKEEIIAANKARVAKYHPEPDFSHISPAYKQAISKIDFEKKKKRVYMSIVSVPMGGLNKR